MKFWDEHKGLIITIIVIMVIIAIIFFVGKKAGGKYVPNDILIPQDTQAPGTPLNYNPGPVTDAIYEDLDEVWGYHSLAPYESALKLSNSQLAAVYNDWNKRYAEKFDGKTIIQAMEDDFSIIPSYSIQWRATRDALVLRFRSLAGAQGRINR